MKVMITGGAGFIGQNLAYAFLNDQQAKVHILDCDGGALSTMCSNGELHPWNIDITNADALTPALTDIDVVVHLAASSGVLHSIEDPIDCYRTNVLGTLNLLEACRTNGVNLFINASTGGALCGEIDGPVDEYVLPNPIAPYGASKLSTEGLCTAYMKSYGLGTLSLRFSNVFGERSISKSTVVASFMKAQLRGHTFNVYGDGTQERDYIYVQDLCQIIRRCIALNLRGTYQLGSGKGTSLNDLIELMFKVTRTNPNMVNYKEFRTGEVLRTWCNISKIKSQIRNYPNTDLETALTKTWQWFKAQ